MADSPKKRNSYVCTLKPEQVTLLEEYLQDRGWEFKSMQYAHWKATLEKTNVVAYKSGKFTVQGKGTEDFVTFVLEPEILKTVGFGYEDFTEKTTPQEPFVPHAGVDESGKGDFFGSLVVAAVYVDESNYKGLLELGVKDSKVIKSDAKIKQIATAIRRQVNGKFSLVTIGPEAYNRLYGSFNNLNKMLAWGHAKAIENLLEKAPQCNDVLSDKFGAEYLIQNALQGRAKEINLRQQTKAESDIAVAAASILARDAFVSNLERLSKQANLELPKGANSKVSAQALKLAQRDGLQALAQYVKLHFKTYQKIVDQLNNLL